MSQAPRSPPFPVADGQSPGTWCVGPLTRTSLAPGTVTLFLPAMLARDGRVHRCGRRSRLAGRATEILMESGERAAIEAPLYP